MRHALLAMLAMTAMLSTAPAMAETVHFTASLDGASETPPNTSAGKGAADLTLNTDSKTLTWTVTYSDLSGPATMAHLHGPAAVGAAAGVQVPLTPPLDSPMKGAAALTDGQIGDLRGGLWYVNIHTSQHPGGEIRGQILQVK